MLRVQLYAADKGDNDGPIELGPQGLAGLVQSSPDGSLRQAKSFRYVDRGLLFDIAKNKDDAQIVRKLWHSRTQTFDQLALARREFRLIRPLWFFAGHAL